MTKWARIGNMPFFVDGTGDATNRMAQETTTKIVALEVIDFDPAGNFHPEIEWHEVPDNVTPNSVLKDDGTWEIAPVVVPVTPSRTWDAEQVRAGLSLTEKVKWDNNNAPEVVTVKAELPKQAEGLTELLDLLVGAGVISQESKNKILA